MNRKQWYFYSLLLPFVLPFIILLLARIAGTLYNSQTILGWLSFASIMQLLFGGFQYFSFIFFVRWWAREKSSRQMMIASWAIPLWFWPWCAFWLLLASLYIGLTKQFIILGLCAIPFGYFYVVIVHALTWAGQKTGFIRE